MREASPSENEIEEQYEEPTQANLEETLDAGLYQNDSLWNSKKRYIETRPKNWLSRFTHDYTPVFPSITPKVQPKEVNYKVVVLTEPEKPIYYKVDDLKAFNDTTLQSNLCLMCWKLVIVGPTRIKCLHCPVVVHRYCVTNIADFFVPVEEQESPHLLSTTEEVMKPSSPKKRHSTTNPHANPPPPLSSRDHDPISLDTQSLLPVLKTTTAFRREKTSKPKTRIPVSSPATAARRPHRNSEESLPYIASSASPFSARPIVDTRHDETTREVRWRCPFCIHEVNVGNDFNSRKYTRLLALHRAKKAIIQIQSVLRMYPKRAKFLRMTIACRTIQRFHRSRNFRRALIRERTNQKRAVRIRIHELTLYLTDSEDMVPPILESAPRVFGQFGANMLPRYLADTPPLPSKYLQDGSLAALINGNGDRRVQQGHASLSKKSVMIEMIRASTVGSHHHQLQMPVKDMNGFPFPTKSLFLTVTATRVEGSGVSQVYRVDVPMRDIAMDKEGYQRYTEERRESLQSHGSNSRPQTTLASSDSRLSDRDSIAYYEVIDEVSRLLEGDSMTLFGSNVSKIKIYPPKPMILFPALPANVRIYFTVSEVTEWPRARLVGQCSIQGDNWLIWRQVATISQSLTSASNDDMPKPDSHSRLQVHLWNSNTVETESNQSLSGRKAKGDHSTSPTKKSSKSKHKVSQYVGGRVLWSLIPSSFISAIAGPLFFLPQAAITSAKKRSWCVVLDGCLIIYSHITDIRTKEIIELAYCNIFMLEAEVMKIHRPKSDGPIRGIDQTWFCFCAVPNLREEWFKIIKENCMNTKKKK